MSFDGHSFSRIETVRILSADVRYEPKVIALMLDCVSHDPIE
jgi:hypothetical protein